MVDYKKLSEILAIDDIKERDIKLRVAFAAYSKPIDVTSFEKEALTILVNLTHKRTLVEDLCDQNLAKNTFLDENHIDKCLKEVKWLHTHNVKYPDIKVSKQRVISRPLAIVPNSISSANFDPFLGWSHNSATVNLVKMFVSHFYWRDELVCLASLMKRKDDSWRKFFKFLGITLKKYQELCEEVGVNLPLNELPESINDYSIQALFPYYNDYLSITPVVSHAVQSNIQLQSRLKHGKYRFINHTRPSSVSELSSSLGGNIAVLNYPPKLRNHLKSYNDIKQDRILNGENVFYHKAISSNYFAKTLDALIYSDNEQTYKKRRKKKLLVYRQIRSSLTQWLAPIVEWREDIENNKLEVDNLALPSPLIHSLLTEKEKVDEQIINSVFSLLNSYLPEKYAYHQTLILPLRGLLKGILNKLTNTEKHNDSDNEECLRYLHLKNIQVFDAEALSNPYCLGISSLTAVYGMLHNYQRRLNERIKGDIRFGSFSWFLRHYSTVQGTVLPSFSYQTTGDFKRSGIIDKRFCDLTFDIVIKVFGDEDELMNLTENLDILMASFPSRFAGGTMLPNSSEKGQWCNLYDGKKTLFSKMKKLPSFGKWVSPISSSAANLSEFVDQIEENQGCIAVMAGFNFLEKPKERNNSIAKLHCYAEPLIGLAKLIDGIEIKINGKRNFHQHVFWQVDVQEHFLRITKAN